jgi:hypothetical protein
MPRRKMLNRIWYRIREVVVAFIVALVITIAAINIAKITINSAAVLQSLIQAEATILGFFGIIVTYLLTSYDTRLDRFEQQRFDARNSPADLKKVEIINISYLEVIDDKIRTLKRQKKEIAGSMGLYAFLLALSLLFSVITLGMIDSGSPYLDALSVLGLSLFFLGVVGIVIVFLQISTES